MIHDSLPAPHRRNRLVRLSAATVFSLAVAMTAAASLGYSQTPMTPEEIALEKQIREIAIHLRSPCCPTLNVAQHNSPTTLAMKRDIREMLEAGEGRRAIIATLKEKYGDEIAPGMIPALWKPYLYVGGPIVGILFIVFLGRWLMAHEKSPAVLHVDAGAKADASGK